MKKIFIIAFLVLLTLCISAAILINGNRTTQQNKTSDSNTKNVAEDTDSPQKNTNTKRKYYIENDEKYHLKSLCFTKNECYSLNPDIIEIKNKQFVGFGAYHYYDISTYKYDKDTNTYSVDILIDRDPSTDLGVSNKCPFDRGNITHLIFALTYNPLEKNFNATYKGFVSSEDIVEYENGEPASHYVNYINIYFNNNPAYIKDLNNWLDFFNKEVPKTIGKSDSYGYDIEIEYIIPYYNS